jgi:hypothetical protein
MMLFKLSLAMMYMTFLNHAATACGNAPDPELIIKQETDWTAELGHCADYELLFPSEFNSEQFNNATLQHGTGHEQLVFNFRGNPQFAKSKGGHLVRNGLTSFVICANPDWLDEATLHLVYKKEAVGDSVSLCVSGYSYNNLNDFVIKK